MTFYVTYVLRALDRVCSHRQDVRVGPDAAANNERMGVIAESTATGDRWYGLRRNAVLHFSFSFIYRCFAFSFFFSIEPCAAAYGKKRKEDVRVKAQSYVHPVGPTLFTSEPIVFYAERPVLVWRGPLSRALSTWAALCTDARCYARLHAALPESVVIMGAIVCQAARLGTRLRSGSRPTLGQVQQSSPCEYLIF